MFDLAKSQKIASATYLLTSFFSDSEPLKWKLRATSTDLVSEREKDKNNLIQDLISLFALAKNSGLLSETNHELVVGELKKFKESLELPLEMGLFQVSAPAEPELPQLNPAPIFRDKISLTSPQPVRKTLDKGSLRETREPARPLKEFGAVSVKKNSRQSVIIGLLKRKKEIMIKDVSPLISGCSEKTIQRELSAMVAAGILRKIGEKRWSRYTLSGAPQYLA